MDHKGYVSYWNPASETILGYTSEEIIGRNLHEVLTPKRYLHLHKDALAVFQKNGKGRAVNQTLELEACHKNSHEISIGLSLSAIKISGTFHAIGIVRDITHRKKTEEELKKSEERFKTLHHASFGGIAIHDKG